MDRKLYSKSEPLVPVETPVVGTKYHLSWARDHGMVWVLKQITGVHGIMETPRTKRRLTVKLADLRHVRENQQRLEEGNVLKIHKKL